LRALIDGSAHAIVAIAPDNKVLLWNKSAERIFGHATHEVVGDPYPMIPASGRGAFRDLFARACDGQAQSNVLLDCVRKDGTSVQVRCGGAPFYDASGMLRGVAYMLEDVTEQLATEAMLRQAQKMEAVGTLTGGLAHDFNNLLAIVMLNLENILDHGVEDVVHEKIQRALDAAERGGELTRQLLTFARRQPLRPRPLDLNELIGKTVKLLDRALGEQVVIRFEPTADLPKVAIDGAQLDSAVVNLSVNARDAMPGGGLLTIRTCMATLNEAETSDPVVVPPGSYVTVEVSDTGTGMPAHVLKRIFEPFFTTKEPGKGTGLGLSMVFGFVKQSRGYTTVSSVEGQGTTFRLYLPIEDAGVLSANDGPVAQGVARGAGERILVVDDNAQIRAVIVGQLKSLGYRPVEAATPLDALRIIDGDDGIALLFTDVVMPGGMDGLALARAARKRRPGLRVLTTSGFPGENPASASPQGAAFPLLAKPYRRQALAVAIAETLASASTAADAAA
jgi:PAS domain S-box-containing protein